MKAAYIERHGGPEVLKFGDMPDPLARAGEVVVDIVAASVNGADWKVREGKSGQLPHFPYILGRDFFGGLLYVFRGNFEVEFAAASRFRHVVCVRLPIIC